MSGSFGALIALGFLGNIFVPLAGRFLVWLLSLRTHFVYHLSKGVCDNACAVSTIQVSSDKLKLNINFYTSGQPTTSGLYSLPRDSQNYKPQNIGKIPTPDNAKKTKNEIYLAPSIVGISCDFPRSISVVLL